MPARKYIWVAEMETERFTWMGIGRTKDEAVAGLRKRWNEHAKRVRKDGFPIALFDEDPQDPETDPRDWEPDEKRQTVPDYYGMWLRRMEFGEGYMDSEGADD